MESLPHYVIIDDLLPPAVMRSLGNLAEAEDRWKLHEEWFFSQFDFTWIRRTYGQPRFGELSSDLEMLRALGIRLCESKMNAVIGNHFTVVAHKMVPGQLVGIHNDSPDQDRGRIENFRLICYTDEAFSDANGGHLFLFGSRDESDILEGIRPVFNSGVLLHLSDKSFHAVSKVKQGIRYCVVASYWGYPLPVAEGEVRSRVAKCIRRIIAAGLEEKGHSGTTFAYHLYNTYRMLTNWGAPAHVCLAGLMHSVLGRDLSALPVTGISHEEVLSTVGSEAFAVISAFKASATLEKHGTLLSGSAGDALLVEVANTLEQAQDDEEFCQVNRLADDLPECYGGIRQRIQADVIQFRNQLRNRAFAEGAGSSCHHGS